MSQIVIVTEKCYLVCESINFITIDEVEEDCAKESAPYPYSSSRRRKKKASKLTREERIQNARYKIVINFVPLARSGQGSPTSKNYGDNSAVGIVVYGRSRCLQLFGSIVEQIREQMPDQIFLDKLVERLISQEKQ